MGPADDSKGTSPTASPVGPETPERGSHSSTPPRINVYVDGFNLYFGCLEDTPYRWLDVEALCHHLLDPIFAEYTLQNVRYFTARVSDYAGRPGSAERQNVYLRALGSIPNLSIHEGRFQVNDHVLPVIDDYSNLTGDFAHVIKSEEKGSDVNLASYLLVDAIDKQSDISIVMSNDTDLLLPIKLLRERFGVKVGVAAPAYFKNRRPNRSLAEASDFNVPITRANKSCLKACQFPEVVQLGNGKSVTRPQKWAPAAPRQAIPAS